MTSDERDKVLKNLHHDLESRYGFPARVYATGYNYGQIDEIHHYMCGKLGSIDQRHVIVLIYSDGEYSIYREEGQ